MTNDELMDVVDEKDRVIGQAWRSDLYAARSCQFRVINAMVENARGELWIPRRTATKKMFPLCLDASVGGHVRSGEGYQAAFFRETREEINLDLHKAHWQELGTLTPYTHGTSAFMRVYQIFLDASPVFNPEDFISCAWISPQALLETLQNGQPAKDDLPIILKAFYGV